MRLSGRMCASLSRLALLAGSSGQAPVPKSTREFQPASATCIRTDVSSRPRKSTFEVKAARAALAAATLIATAAPIESEEPAMTAKRRYLYATRTCPPPGSASSPTWTSAGSVTA